MHLASAASALPEHLYRQDVLTNALKEYWGDKCDRPQLLERFHARAGVRQRYLAFPLEQYARFSGWGETNRAWMQVAEHLGQRALDSALDRAGLTASDLDALFVVSVTGIASPSLDARLINLMNLRADLKRLPVFGLGCVAGAAGLSRAADYVKAYPDQVAALLSVELCSLTMRLDDFSTANLIATGIFGDGAVAALVTGAQRKAHSPAIIDHCSIFYPGTEDIMGWDISEKGFQIVLSPRLPDLIIQRLRSDVDSFLARSNLTRAAIGSWLVHPGGPKVIEAVERALGLCDGELAVSWDILARFGNLSSGSVLLVLEELMMHQRPAAGTIGLLMAMGTGFCAELMLLRW
jgi:alkylresorcinol/alkylpyrone synthase